MGSIYRNKMSPCAFCGLPARHGWHDCLPLLATVTNPKYAYAVVRYSPNAPNDTSAMRLIAEVPSREAAFALFSTLKRAPGSGAFDLMQYTERGWHFMSWWVRSTKEVANGQSIAE